MGRSGSARPGAALALPLVLALGAAASSARAQAPAPSPHYVSLFLQVDVARPAAAVWARVGKYCDIAEWLNTTCRITAGKDDEVGTVRELKNGVVEILVGRTPLSYAYAQPDAPGARHRFYHGAMEVRPVTPTTSRILYSLYYDDGPIADPAERARDYSGRAALFRAAMQRMKALAEAPCALTAQSACR